MAVQVNRGGGASGGERVADGECPRRHGRLLAAAAVMLAMLLAGHRLVPRALGAGGLLESFLPWLGLGVPVLGLVALLRRTAWAALALVLPAAVWSVLFGPALLWSRYPIRDSRWITLGPGQRSVLRAVVAAPGGPLAVWVAHPPRLRLGVAQPRDAQLQRLGRAVAADPVPRLLLVGDLNTAATDRALGPLQRRLRSAQVDAGSGLGFTWPARLPVLRIDHVYYRGLDAVDAWVLGRTGSDHRPVLADLRMTTSPS